MTAIVNGSLSVLYKKYKRGTYLLSTFEISAEKTDPNALRSKHLITEKHLSRLQPCRRGIGASSDDKKATVLHFVKWKSTIYSSENEDVEPKNEGLEDDFSFSNRWFSASKFIFQGVHT